MQTGSEAGFDGCDGDKETESLEKGNPEATNGKLLPPSTGARANVQHVTSHLAGGARPTEGLLLNCFNEETNATSFSMLKEPIQISKHYQGLRNFFLFS